MGIPELHIVLAGRDLQARDRLARAAGPAAGQAVAGVAHDRLLVYLRDHQPIDALVVDLDEGGDDVLAVLAEARAQGLLPARVLGYFSHVREEIGEQARAAGVEAYPRSRFWRELAGLLGAPS